MGRSGVRGVCYNLQTGGWRVIRHVNGKQVNYGNFSDFEEAKIIAAEVSKICDCAGNGAGLLSSHEHETLPWNQEQSVLGSPNTTG